MDNNYLPHWLNAAGYRTECEYIHTLFTPKVPKVPSYRAGSST